MFTNIKELLPRRIEALGVNEKITAQNVKTVAGIQLKKLLKELNNSAQNVSVKEIKKNTLIISVKNPQWAARVYLVKENLKTSLEDQFPNIKIKEISIIIEEKS